MAKKAKRASRAKKLTVKKESLRARSSVDRGPVPNAIVINPKAVRGMVIDRSAVSLFKRAK